MKKVAVFIGRFAPLHNGHIENIKFCQENYDETIVLVGSGNKRRTTKNPFAFSIIKKWINQVNPNAFVVSINDYIYNDYKWISQVQEICYGIIPRSQDVEFTIVGHEKDNTSFYLDMFPTWKVYKTPEFADGISATEIRDLMFCNKRIALKSFCENKMPLSIIADIITFMDTENFKELLQEDKYFKGEEQKFSLYPYPDTLKFNCSDAVVVCEGHVLLIERKVAPGKGTWALPGGFVNTNETYEQAAIRELFEETSLKIPEKVLKGSMKGSKIFDNPNRNIGIPRISNAFYFTIAPDYKNGFAKLPKIKGADDAANARWVSLYEVKNLVLFDDHSDIIEYFVNTY